MKSVKRDGKRARGMESAQEGLDRKKQLAEMGRKEQKKKNRKKRRKVDD